jgi:metal-responsive CopG/Arc/MetJ family transcriptional regulator
MTSMERTTVSLPKELLKRVRAMAEERNVSVAEIIREAAEEKAAKHEPQANGKRPKPKSIGIFDSGKTDIARRSADLKLEPPEWRSS